MAEKGKLLFLERFFWEYTDDEHPVTTQELIRIYEENNFKASRNTISGDVDSLNAAGVEILC